MVKYSASFWYAQLSLSVFVGTNSVRSSGSNAASIVSTESTTHRLKDSLLRLLFFPATRGPRELKSAGINAPVASSCTSQTAHTSSSTAGPTSSSRSSSPAVFSSTGGLIGNAHVSYGLSDYLSDCLQESVPKLGGAEEMNFGMIIKYKEAKMNKISKSVMNKTMN